jgi:hypothetical protein
MFSDANKIVLGLRKALPKLVIFLCADCEFLVFYYVRGQKRSVPIPTTKSEVERVQFETVVRW